MIDEINRASALASLRPGARWSMLGDVITWNDETQQPTEEEINAEILRLQAEHDAQEYARDRQAEYPSINELVVALWENVVEERAASVIELEGLRQAVKTKHPKP